MHLTQTSDSLRNEECLPHTIDLISTIEAIDALEDDWNRLSKAAVEPNVFMTFDWFRAWFTQFAGEMKSDQLRPHVLVLRHRGEVTGIVPLVRRISAGFGIRVRKLEFVAIFADYYDLILGPDSAGQMEAVVKFLVQTSKEWDMLDLIALHITEEEVDRLGDRLRRHGLSHCCMPEAERCPFIPIDGPWSKIVSRRSSRTRHTFRRMQSRLTGMAEQGLRMRILENPYEEPDLLKKMIAIEAQKRVDGELSMPFLGRYPELFASLFYKLGAKGWLCVAVMELSDRLIGWEIVFLCGKKLWSYQGAYDREFARLSPGTMLLPKVIDYFYPYGYTEYDFLKGEELYKLQWADDFHQTYQMLIWSRRWISRVRKFIYQDLRTPIYRILRKHA